MVMKVDLDPRMTNTKVAPPCCINCKHVRLERKMIPPANVKCQKYKTIDVVTGDISYNLAEKIRNDETKCGIKGRDFEEQDMIDKVRVKANKLYCETTNESIIIFIFWALVFLIIKYGYRTT